MSNTLDTQEIALERLRNVLIIFEKKKRNLDKRKNKLDEYKKKKDLNEDQQMAVSKYQEVVSNLELVDELNTLALQQIKDAEKAMKKTKKLEKLENKRHETSLIEFAMKTHHLLERIFDSEPMQSKLLLESHIDAAELQLLKELHQEVHTDDKSNWKKCSEHFQSLYEGGTKPTDLNVPDDHALRSVSKDELLKCIEKLSNIDWIVSGVSEDSRKSIIDHEPVENCDNDELEQPQQQQQLNLIEAAQQQFADDIEEDPQQQQQMQQQNELQLQHEEQSLPIAAVNTNETDAVPDKSIQPDNPKLSFVFLHESIVQDESSPGATARTTAASENGYIDDPLQQHAPLVPRSGSQMSGKSVGHANPNNAWYYTDVDNSVDDVFSSATQSEFMHSENNRNLKMRGQRQPTNNGRFRSRGATAQAAPFAAVNRDVPIEAVNYWKSNNRGAAAGGGAFSSNPRYPRSSRGRGTRGRGNGRADNRVPNEEMLTSMQ